MVDAKSMEEFVFHRANNETSICEIEVLPSLIQIAHSRAASGVWKVNVSKWFFL